MSAPRGGPGPGGLAREGSRAAGLALAAWTALGVGAEARADMRHRAAPPAAAAPARPEPFFPIGVRWLLADIDGRATGGDAPTFQIDDQLRATGFSGCNTYSMTLYPVRGGHLAGGAIALTRKVCDKAAMADERTFLVALHSGPTWSVVGGDLVIRAGRTTLRFRRGV